jgi:hypothetical protein
MGLGRVVSKGLEEADARERQARMQRRAKRRSRGQDLKQRGVIGDPPAAGALKPARQRRPAPRRQAKGGSGGKVLGTVLTVLFVIAIIALKLWARS